MSTTVITETGRGFRKYFGIFSINLKNRVVYLHDLLFSSVFMVLIIFIFLQLWRAVFAGGGLKTLCGFTLADMIWYMVITEAVVLSLPNVNQEIDEQVKSGQIACYLVRPMNFVAYHYTDYLSRVVVRLPVNLLLGGLLALFFVGPAADLPGRPGSLLLVLALAVTLDFIIKMNIGVLAFWMEETSPVFWMYQKLIFTLGGLLIPLDVFPEWLRDICMKLPFRLIPYSVSRLAIDYSNELLLSTLFYFAVWMLPFAVLLALLYRKGVKRLNVHGG